MKRALDLFCGAGGATKGLQRTGFHVTGVDLYPQPRYCGDVFIQGDATTFKFSSTHEFVGGSMDHYPELCDRCGLCWDRHFDFIWASPLCQKHSSLAALHPEREYACFIAETRNILIASGVPWVMENVIGAPLHQPIMLCGSSFGLNVRRHRLFESNFPLRSLACRHHEQPAPIDVSGTGARRIGPRMDGKGGNSRKPLNLAEAQSAMGIDWMNRLEISQAIPPAYSKFIGRQVMVMI